MLFAVGEILVRVDLEVAEFRRQLCLSREAHERQAEGGPQACAHCVKDFQVTLAYSI